MYWGEEDCVSVVMEDLVDEISSVGETCSVKCGKSSYQGRIAAFGKQKLLTPPTFGSVIVTCS